MQNKHQHITEAIYIGDYEIYRKSVGNSLKNERKTVHIFDDKQRIATIDGDVVRYQFADHLGSSSLELDENAEIISYEEYYPFGSTSYRSGRSETEVSQKRYKYVMKELDNETGLYYYGMRYYASWFCRFVSVDPLQHKYPELTPFQYAGNKPISFIDLDGAEEAKSDDNKGDRKKYINIILRNNNISAGNAEKNTVDPKYWKTIWVNNIEDAKNKIQIYLGEDLANTIIFSSHSSNISKSIQVSDKIILTSNDFSVWCDYYCLEENNVISKKNNVLVDPLDNHHLKEISWLNEISLKIEKNGIFIFTSCEAGDNLELGKLLQKVTLNRVNIFLNQDVSSYSQNSIITKPNSIKLNYIRNLTSGGNFEEGWTVTPVSGETYKVSEIEGKEGKLFILDNANKFYELK